MRKKFYSYISEDFCRQVFQLIVGLVSPGFDIALQFLQYAQILLAEGLQYKRKCQFHPTVHSDCEVKLTSNERSSWLLIAVT